MNLAIEELGLARWSEAAMSATGIVGTAVFLVLTFNPNLPMYGDSLGDYARWAPAHQADAHHLLGLLLPAVLLYMVFGLYVATLVGSRDAWTGLMVRVAIVAIGVRVALELIWISILAVPASEPAQDYLGSMADLGAGPSVASLVPHAVFLGAVGIAALVSRAIPVWLGWLTLAVAAIHASALVVGVVVIPLGPIGPVFGLVWFLSITGWPLVTGVALFLIALLRMDAKSLRPSMTTLDRAARL